MASKDSIRKRLFREFLPQDTKYIGKAEPVELSSWNDLLTEDNVTSQQLIDKYFEGILRR